VKAKDLEGQITETTIRKGVIPPELSEQDSTKPPMPDFGEFTEAMTPEDWTQHFVYIYREEPKVSTYAGAGGLAVIDKCPGYIEVRSGGSRRLSERRGSPTCHPREARRHRVPPDPEARQGADQRG